MTQVMGALCVCVCVTDSVLSHRNRVAGGDGSAGWLPVLAQIALPFISTERLSTAFDALTKLKVGAFLFLPRSPVLR